METDKMPTVKPAAGLKQVVKIQLAVMNMNTIGPKVIQGEQLCGQPVGVGSEPADRVHS